MAKVKLTQDQIDGLVVAERVSDGATVYGVGLSDVGFRVRVGGKVVWQYDLWKGVLRRSFDEKEKLRHPTYQNVTCCEEWLSFANFLEWCNKEVGYKGKPVGMQLDKDLIVKGNKVYSPDFCSFVPVEVNKLLTNHVNARGKYPIGVNFCKNSGKFKAQLACFGKNKSLGYYNTPEYAFAAYKIAKEAQIRVVALQHKDVLKPAVFESLMGWEINIDD
jgi:hypothetical protein